MPERRIGVVVFPGTNCDVDIIHAIETVMKIEAVPLWHGDDGALDQLMSLDGVVLPGGFSYGDYLRCGAMAKQSPLMQAVKTFAQAGKHVLGICNGFQILTEAGLLPGALIQNRTQRFLCQQRTGLMIEHPGLAFTNGYTQGQRIEYPIAHGEGCYVADAKTRQALIDNKQIVLRYEDDVNGSVDHIAGICNVEGNVLGMMPHPERNLETQALGGFTGDGAALFRAWANALQANTLESVHNLWMAERILGTRSTTTGVYIDVND